MKIELELLKIINFKGIKDFTLDLSGKSATVSGRNGTGKSTIQDAWHWLWTGSNSEQAAKFNILPLDAAGLPIDHTEASVVAVIQVDGKQVELKKTYAQKWTKKRGQAEREFSGHHTEYFIDSVPCATAREFTDFLTSLVDPGLFRCLSDVRYFCGSMPADRRRAILLDIVGDMADSDVIANNPDLAELDQIINTRELEAHKKILAASRRKMNERLSDIPKLIAELKRGLPDISEYNETELRGKIADLSDTVKAKISDLGRLASGGNIAEWQKEKAMLELRLIELDKKTHEANAKKTEALYKEKDVLFKASNEKHTELISLDAENVDISKQLERLEAEKKEMIQQWREQNARDINVLSATCFACEQPLPDHKISEQREVFNLDKSRNLEKINDHGRILNDQILKLLERRERIADMSLECSRAIQKHDAEMAEIRTKIHDINNSNGVEYSKKHLEIQGQIDELSARIENVRIDIEPEKNVLKTAIAALEDEKAVFESRIAEIMHAQKTEKRISELTAEQKAIAAEYQQSEKELWLIDEFTKRKAEYIESNVNEHFEHTTWKLFDIQVNQGVRSICEAMHKGVPFNSDLNTGHRLIVGMDCINTLSKHYDISLPAFIDNAESLTTWIDFPRQHIRLVVDINDLKVTKEK